MFKPESMEENEEGARRPDPYTDISVVNQMKQVLYPIHNTSYPQSIYLFRLFKYGVYKMTVGFQKSELADPSPIHDNWEVLTILCTT